MKLLTIMDADREDRSADIPQLLKGLQYRRTCVAAAARSKSMSPVRSRIGYTPVSTDRGKRYCGASTMSFVSLLLHGLTSISVCSDIALVRVLLFAGAIMGLSAAAIVVVSEIRFFTTLAIPGWAPATMGVRGSNAA